MGKPICQCCGQEIKDSADEMRSKSEYESLVNRIAAQIIADTGVDCVSACAQAMRQIEKNRELFVRLENQADGNKKAFVPR